jgi:hypothetical protein
MFEEVAFCIYAKKMSKGLIDASRVLTVGTPGSILTCAKGEQTNAIKSVHTGTLIAIYGCVLCCTSPLPLARMRTTARQIDTPGKVTNLEDYWK